MTKLKQVAIVSNFALIRVAKITDTRCSDSMSTESYTVQSVSYQ